MTTAEILASLRPVRAFEPSCVVEDDPGEIVRHAGPPDARARQMLLEQRLARLVFDPAAVAERERRIAIERGKVTPFRRIRTEVTR